MKKILLGSAALVAIFVGPATAADMRLKAPAPEVPAWSWTGMYVGVNAGGTWGRVNTDSSLYNTGVGVQYIPSVVADINAQRTQGLNRSGGIAGVQWGYNVQAGNVVAGVESDINSFRLARTNVKSAFFTGFPGAIPPTYTDSIATSWLYTSRGRIGYASGQWMIYATGGLAATNFSYRHTYVEGTFPGTSNGTETSTIAKTKYGPVVGAGVEFAFLGNLSVKAEYLHFDFGNEYRTASVIFPPAIVGGSTFLHSVRFTADVARIGLNYRFGSL